MKQFFNRMKDYFTVNIYRKIFFIGMILGILLVAWGGVAGVWALRMSGSMVLAMALIASIVDTFQQYGYFNQQVKAMQMEHIQHIVEQQEAGAAVFMTPTFSHAEKKYIRNRRWGYLGKIILKIALIIIIFSLLVG